MTANEAAVTAAGMSQAALRFFFAAGGAGAVRGDGAVTSDTDYLQSRE